MGPALLIAVVIVAAFVIRTAVAELRHPGAGNARWTSLKDTRALAAGAVTAGVLAWPGWLQGGAEGLVWAVLAAVLVAFVVSKQKPAG
ncbi:hypothetical protein ACN6AT_04535 [Streptomyces sp. JL4002]|uniref:hypothetical protein n=1 Tax=Streptomyces TaxID=1883 RepID=UPI0036C4D006